LLRPLLRRLVSSLCARHRSLCHHRSHARCHLAVVAWRATIVPIIAGPLRQSLGTRPASLTLLASPSHLLSPSSPAPPTPPTRSDDDDDPAAGGTGASGGGGGGDNRGLSRRRGSGGGSDATRSTSVPFLCSRCPPSVPFLCSRCPPAIALYAYAPSPCAHPPHRTCPHSR
jgi:hypothetical protein